MNFSILSNRPHAVYLEVF